MGLEEETKKLGEKNNDIKAEAKVESGGGVGWGGARALHGLICLFACVCVCAFCWPKASLGQVHGPVDSDYMHSLTH